MADLDGIVALIDGELVALGLSWRVVGLLLLAAFAAGFVDSIAGGGGLITVPALLLSGLPPLTALGVNKLQALFGSGAATVAYARRGLVNPARRAPSVLLAFLGAAAGAMAVSILPLDQLRTIIPVLLVLVAAYFAVRPDVGALETAARWSPALFAGTAVPLIGFYDGLLGPGTGSFFMLALVGLAGFEMLKATAHAKLLNFASNLGGFAVFALAGTIVWWLGLLMGAGQSAGAMLGARTAMARGRRVIRPLLVLVCLAMAARLLWS